MFKTKRSFLAGLAAGALVSFTGLGPALAQSDGYPNKPVMVVVPFAAGNVLDTALRQVGEEFKKITGQQLLIDNKPGGSGIIAAQNVANAKPDGYTLLLGTVSMLTVNPSTFSKLPYDPDKSFRHITAFYGSSLVMAVNAANVPVNNVKEFVAWAKSRSQPVTFASFTAGNTSHFLGVLFNKHAGLDMIHVPYNGTPPAMQNLVGGQVDVAFLPMVAVAPHMKTGKVKVLAVGGEARSPMAPDVPTFKELGYPEMTNYIWSSLAAPAGTPDAVINKLHSVFDKILREPEIRTKWGQVDGEPLPMTPAEFSKFMHADMKRWAEAVRISGFKASE